MTEGRLRSQWDMAAPVLCILMNANRDPKKRAKPFQVQEVHPFLQLDAKRQKKNITWSPEAWQAFGQAFKKRYG